MHAPHRRLLLELYRALQAAAPASREAAARAYAAAWELPLQLEVAVAPAAAARLAVRLVHELEMRAAPLCVWLGPLAEGAGATPALQVALAGAPLLAGRDGRALLAIPLDAAAGVEPAGALVDAETCARIALGGGELESGRAGALELLELAGDLVPTLPPGAPVGPGAPVAPGVPCAAGAVLLAALRLAPAEAARCLGRVAVITMPD